MTYKKTRSGTLNSNIESIFVNDENCSIGKRKSVLFRKIPHFTPVLLPVQSDIKNGFKKTSKMSPEKKNLIQLKLEKTLFERHQNNGNRG